MSYRFRATLLPLLLAGCVLLALPAHAEPILEGQVFGVFADSGSFSTTTDYTIVHFANFVGDYPGGMIAQEFPIADWSFGTDPASSEDDQSITFTPGAEFFLVGYVQTMDPDTGLSAGDPHLLISTSGPRFPDAPYWPGDQDPGERLHDALAVGSRDLAGRLPGPGAPWSTSADAFWDIFDALYVEGEDASGTSQTANDLFALTFPNGGSAVVQLNDAGVFEGGAQDLFGHVVPLDPYEGQLTIGEPNPDGSFPVRTLAFEAVPEPATFGLVVGALGLFVVRRRRGRAWRA